MATLHFLNVREGDCSFIQHNSERVTVIDVCNAKPVDVAGEAALAHMARFERGVTGDFQQKKYPVNPIAYLGDHGVSSVFRYIQTHPDMDHMDGIKPFFAKFDCFASRGATAAWPSPRPIRTRTRSGRY